MIQTECNDTASSASMSRGKRDMVARTGKSLGAASPIEVPAVRRNSASGRRERAATARPMA